MKLRLKRVEASIARKVPKITILPPNQSQMDKNVGDVGMMLTLKVAGALPTVRLVRDAKGRGISFPFATGTKVRMKWQHRKRVRSF